MMPPVQLAVTMALLGLVPLTVVVASAFLKISVVLMLLRNALGVQQTPPNVAIYGLALILSVYVMMPPLHHAWVTLSGRPEAMSDFTAFYELLRDALTPLREFLLRNCDPANLDFFFASTRQLWPESVTASLAREDFVIVLPAFVVSELTAAFQIGFLLYLPFAVIDLIVQSILLALGMMMMSPMTLALPLKLLLFVLVDGWTRLISALVLSYAV